MTPRVESYRGRDAGSGGSHLDDRSRIDTSSQIDTRSRFRDRARYDDRGRYDDRRGDDRNRFDDRDNNDNRRNNGRAYEGRGYQNRETFDGRYGDGRNGDRGYGDRSYSGSERWNRGWRGDDRYDWNHYRAGNRNVFRLPRYYSPYGWDGGYRRFSIGVTLSSVLLGRNYWIDDPFAYRLPEAYGPYRWVRYYNDALLVDLRSGFVVDTVYGIFY